MITVTMHRIDRGRESFLNEREVPWLKAMRILAGAEIAFGARFASASLENEDVRLVVHTSILNMVDVTHFKGPVEEMAPLVKLMYLVHKARETDGFMEEVEADLKCKLGEKIGIPLYLSMGAPLSVGRISLNRALLLALEEEDPAGYEAAQDLSISDIIATYELSKELDQPFAEIVRQIEEV